MWGKGAIISFSLFLSFFLVTAFFEFASFFLLACFLLSRFISSSPFNSVGNTFTFGVPALYLFFFCLLFCDFLLRFFSSFHVDYCDEVVGLGSLVLVRFALPPPPRAILVQRIPYARKKGTELD